MRGIILTLAMPPTGFVVLILIGMLLRGGWRRFGRRVAWTSLIALILFGMPVVSSNLLLALETGLPTTPPADNPPQAIVVLGGDVIRTHQEKLGIRPGLLTLDRLRTAAALHRGTGLPILVTGGTTQPGTPPVGMVMDESLKDDFQTPARWVESKSADTWENARFSADILRAEGITSVYVVTHAWHMRRAVLAFQGTGLTVTAAPTSLDDPLGPDLSDFLPRAAGWQTGYFAIHEWIGYAWYKLR
ncbi:MAG: YdcF family protein [Rhodopila sp.]|nr:YdcF family protein [Rhodopila sp.]